MKAKSKKTGALVPAACLALIAAAFPQWASAADEDARITARGNEPGWSLTIDGDQIDLVTNMGAETATFTRPKAQVTTRYVVGGGPTISISDSICADTMSGMQFPLTVTVEQAGETLSGCGGEPASLLTGDEWTVESIGGNPTVPKSNVTVTFAEDGSISGSASCNRFFGGWNLTGEGLSFGQLGSTMMACIEPELGEQEHAFFEAIGSISRFEIASDGALVLVAGDTPAIVARR